jgi:hypothetical protein
MVEGEAEMGEHARAGELDIWIEQVGEGSDVLLIGGLGQWNARVDVFWREVEARG